MYYNIILRHVRINNNTIDYYTNNQFLLLHYLRIFTISRALFVNGKKITFY